MTGSDRWWPGTRLVAGRSISDSARSRVWRITTILMVLAGLALVIVPRLLGHDAATYRLATVGVAPAGVRAALERAGSQVGFRVEFRPTATVPEAVQAVRDGDADAALTGVGAAETLYVNAAHPGVFPALVSQAAVAQARLAAMLEAGLQRSQADRIAAIGPPRQEVVGGVPDNGRLAVGIIVGIVLYVVLLMSGMTIANAVAAEKTTRISEVLLAVLRPTQMLTGTVLGVGAVMSVQVAALTVPTVASLVLGGQSPLPASAAGDIAVAMCWFALGLVLYAFVFAALGALVTKPTEVGAATMPATAALVGSYLLSVTLVAQDPDSWTSVLASLFPLSAPLAMPVRWASGAVPPWQLVLAMALTAASAWAVARLASRMYSRGITQAGTRLRIREALTSPDA